ncbi:aspartic proteinase 36-like [Phragmites australis]|uniref:aspartic proteinase 36-like n=1 Tax=Phragmites australis TaxID=29695 RepID=UPI002D796F86|nr:aspartic proteinase 36-like [Phragmites australis]
MASHGRRRPGSLQALSAVLLLAAAASASAAAGSPDRPAPGPPLVLPLTLSYPNASRLAALPRRGLGYGTRPNARMSLHDDLLTNGYYTTRLYIGTPPQEFALIVDSGSTVTYVPCASCEQCGNHQDPRFQPDLSSTYSPVKCNVDCSCDNDKNQCTYERQYAEMSSSSGVLGEDIVSFGRESELKPQRAVFGCENSETGDLFSQHADGIMGLGRGQLSIMDQLVDKGVISNSFSLCYGGMDIGGGAMVLGGMPAPSDMVFSRSDPVRSPYYNIELKEIHVAGKALRLDPRIFNSKHGTVLDSGTTYAYLPEQAFVAFKDAVTSKVHSLKKIRGPDPNYKDICFAGAGRNVSQLSEVFPDVDMVFGNGQKLSLTPENYLFRHSKVDGAYCLGVFQNGKDPTTLLGGIIVRNTLVTYDRHNEKIGFWKTNCSELWERLHIGGATSPAPSSDTGSQADMSPAPAPSGLPEFDVGLITVDMSINVTYPNLKPHLHELAELIAKELEIDSRQVRVMNVTSQGNSTLIRWGIFPAGSDNAMSNATAMGIIYRLTQHHVRLPENLGSYQLLEWNVQPLSRRSWFQEHVVSILIGILLVILLTLSAFLVLLVWRKKFRGQTAYRPVDSVGPEQELQPL